MSGTNKLTSLLKIDENQEVRFSPMEKLVYDFVKESGTLISMDDVIDSLQTEFRNVASRNHASSTLTSMVIKRLSLKVPCWSPDLLLASSRFPDGGFEELRLLSEEIPFSKSSNETGHNSYMRYGFSPFQSKMHTL